MAGVDRLTGKWLKGWPHVLQSLTVIFSTAVGSRIMRRTFGSHVPVLLGRSLTPALILRFKTAIIVGIELWEPRFNVVAIDTAGATRAGMQLGQLPLRITGEYMPRGHLGDPTVESLKSILAGVGAGKLEDA